MSTKVNIIASIVVLMALWGLHEYDKYKDIKAVKSEMIFKSKEYKKQSDNSTQKLIDSHKKSLKVKDEELKTVIVSKDSIIKRLQQRPVRPNVVTVTGTRESCTGTQLYREDGEFLIREAARAEKVRIERDFYYKKYEEARIELEKLNDQ